MKDYHCCATCRHFKINKTGQSINYFCGRLGYQTQSKYKFNCWDPKDHIKKLMAANKNTSN